MTVTICTRDSRQELSDPLEMDKVLTELLKRHETTFFIERPTNEQMSIVCTRKGSVVICANYNDPYVALDASRTPTWDARWVNLRAQGELTPLPANIVIKKRDVRTIARAFAVNCTRSSTVYWLREEKEPR